LQDVFNLLPNLNVNELIKAFAGNLASFVWFNITDLIFSYSRNPYCSSIMFPFFCAVKTNDMMLVIYLSSLIRSVIALHNLINNKVGSFYLLLMLFQLLYAFLVYRLISLWSWSLVMELRNFAVGMKSCLLIAVIPDAKQGAWEGWGFETNRHSYCCRELNMLLITDWWPRKGTKLVMTC
jgi:hypothetical protein